MDNKDELGLGLGLGKEQSDKNVLNEIYTNSKNVIESNQIGWTKWLKKCIWVYFYLIIIVSFISGINIIHKNFILGLFCIIGGFISASILLTGMMVFVSIANNLTQINNKLNR